ncbi:hypothetical protein CALCODRAFT_521837 [Calocera cornea HHB12733]|uniref:Putative Zn2Cys6 domain-containing protein n=1 Tax=Calocera cornea HHB12733 TaxID=1353952 RepID=A0A165CE38_9BASI|nr:hypothetical protein CALCODRAFT_521837 [Calocera cornea HHB12733]
MSRDPPPGRGLGGYKAYFYNRHPSQEERDRAERAARVQAERARQIAQAEEQRAQRAEEERQRIAQEEARRIQQNREYVLRDAERLERERAAIAQRQADTARRQYEQDLNRASRRPFPPDIPQPTRRQTNPQGLSYSGGGGQRSSRQPSHHTPTPPSSLPRSSQNPSASQIPTQYMQGWQQDVTPSTPRQEAQYQAWYKQWMSLVVQYSRAPMRGASHNYIRTWTEVSREVLRSLRTEVPELDDTVRNAPFLRLMLVYLEDGLVRFSDTMPRLPNLDPLRHPGYVKPPRLDGSPHDLLRGEPARMIKHSTLPAETVISACKTPQHLIDEIWRNGVYILPPYGQYDIISRDTALQIFETRAAFMEVFFTMLGQNRIKYFDEAIGVVRAEAVYLISWYLRCNFSHPFPNRALYSHAFDIDALAAEVQRMQPAETYCHDFYSSFYLESRWKPWAKNRPRIPGREGMRIVDYYNGVQQEIRPSLLRHDMDGAAFTEEASLLALHILQSVFDALYSDDDRLAFPLEHGLLPRVLLENLNISVNGRWLQKPTGHIRRKHLIGKARFPMPEKEFDYRYLQYSPARKAHIKAMVEAGYLPAEDSSDSDTSMAEPSRTKRIRRSKRKEGQFPDYLLRSKFWEIKTYSLDTFPSIDVVREKGRVRIADPFVPAPFYISWGLYACYCCNTMRKTPRTGLNRVCRRWVRSQCAQQKITKTPSVFMNDTFGNISCLLFDETGDRNVELPYSIIDNIIREKWFGSMDADDFPDPDIAAQPEVYPVFNYAGLMDAKANKRVSNVKALWVLNPRNNPALDQHNSQQSSQYSSREGDEFPRWYDEEADFDYNPYEDMLLDYEPEDQDETGSDDSDDDDNGEGAPGFD